MNLEGGERRVFRTRFHWVTMLRPVSKWTALGIVGAVLVLAFGPSWAQVLALFGLASGVLVRWQIWRDEALVLTTQRVVRITGIPGITRTEAWLRVDRVSAVLVRETVPGKILGYGTLSLEAPGDDALRNIHFVPAPRTVHEHLRALIFRTGPASPAVIATLTDMDRGGVNDTAPIPDIG